MMTCLLLTGCISSVVKHHKSPPVSNVDIEPTVPFVTPVDTHPTQNNINPGSYDMTNDIIMFIGVIILIICFAPLILSFADYTFEVCRDKISNMKNKTK